MAVCHTMVELHAVPELFWVLETQREGLPAGLAPASPLFSISLLCQDGFGLGWARPLPEQRMASRSLLPTLLGQALSCVFMMWCQSFKFTSDPMARFLLWRAWPSLLLVLLLLQLLPIASIYSMTGISHTFIISFIPIILLPIKRTCFLQSNKLAAIHPTGSISIWKDLVLFAVIIISQWYIWGKPFIRQL